MHDRLETFMDRREALVLFDLLRGRDPEKPWPLLPILAFLAVGGSGKSMLITYLRATKCRATLPYAHLDFTVAGTPTDLLTIMIRLRDELQRQADDQGRHLRFSRFDLGALLAQASSTGDLEALEPHEIQRKLATGTQLIESLGFLGSSLSTTLPVVGPLVAGLKLAGQLPVVRDTLASLEARTGWTWYRRQGTVTGLGAEATFKDVLLRLQALSLPGTPERDLLVSELLPTAFIGPVLRKRPCSRKLDKCGTVLGRHACHADRIPRCSAKLSRKPVFSAQVSLSDRRLSAQLTSVYCQKLCR
jgi:hypothetical protein